MAALVAGTQNIHRAAGCSARVGSGAGKDPDSDRLCHYHVHQKSPQPPRLALAKNCTDPPHRQLQHSALFHGERGPQHAPPAPAADAVRVRACGAVAGTGTAARRAGRLDEESGAPCEDGGAQVSTALCFVVYFVGLRHLRGGVSGHGRGRCGNWMSVSFWGCLGNCIRRRAGGRMDEQHNHCSMLPGALPPHTSARGRHAHLHLHLHSCLHYIDIVSTIPLHTHLHLHLLTMFMHMQETCANAAATHRAHPLRALDARPEEQDDPGPEGAEEQVRTRHLLCVLFMHCA
ncbi:hypothetical protein EVG20_g5639 [Dentipellis fragilis]|uniref:Uncharacterized protein n=1 Tax=Dentipellis fragilis TaxID=205917 RepID=A0A4Y9YUE1_9AGAM|nr:hypothetical protein EVG20_g5639 [Dentipellis fragilis]